MRMLLVLTLLTACGKKAPSLEEEVKKWTPKVDAKLAAVSTIASALPTVDGKPYAGPSLSLVDGDGPKLVGDTVLTYRADLTALAGNQSPPTMYDRHRSSLEIPACWYIMKQGKYGSFSLSNDTYGAFALEPGQGLQVEMLCDQVAQASFVAVVSPGASAGGTADVPDDSKKQAESFTAGTAAGTIDVFELATGTYKGRLSYAAKNRGSVEYKTTSSGAGASMDADAAISKDLREQIWRSIETALSKR